MKKKQTNSTMAAIQKPLAICAVLVVCALIYLLVSIQGNTARAYAEPTATSPATAGAKQTEAPRIVTASAFLARLERAGLYAAEDPAKEGAYLIGLSPDDAQQDALTLTVSGNAVRGFVLRLAQPADNDAYGKGGEIVNRLKRMEEERKRAQSARIEALLPPLLNALCADGYFPASVSAAWAVQAGDVYGGAKATREEKDGVSFAALLDADGLLKLLADLS